MEDRPAGAGGGLRTMRRKAVETTKLVATSFLPGHEDAMPIVITPAARVAITSDVLIPRIWPNSSA